jgi:hypothetical protein
MYLRPGRIGSVDVGKVRWGEKELLANAVEETVHNLREQGITVVILGSVPTYAHDVPFELARNHEGLGMAYALDPLPDVFESSLKGVAERQGGVYLDVAKVMCQTGNCETEKGGRSNYRDDSHLSVFGALAYSSLIKESMVLNSSARGPRSPLTHDSSQPSTQDGRSGP